jgi:hypothetical protein
MMPLFAGLVAVGVLLSLGAAEVCTSYLVRESIQEDADQLALVALRANLKTPELLGAKLGELNPKLQLMDFRFADGSTVEVRVCGEWQGWVRLPGFGTKQNICADAAAR